MSATCMTYLITDFKIKFSINYNITLNNKFSTAILICSFLLKGLKTDEL